MPATCEPGEAFFDLDEVAGDNLYLCTATNTWSKVAGTGIDGPAGSTQFGVAVFSDTTGGVLAEGTGCGITSVGGKGVLTCDGGFEAGDGSHQGGLITKETAANGGTFEWALFGPADQAGDRCIVFPDQQPAAGQVLTAASTVTDVVLLGKTWTGCRMMEWTAVSGGPVTDDTVLVGNGTGAVEQGLPSCSGTSDKLLYDIAANAFSCGTDQSGTGGGVDCADPANSCLWDDFYGGATGLGTIGALGWRETGTTFAYQAGEDGAPGIARIGTNTTAGNQIALALNQASANEPLLALSDKTFTLESRFRLNRTTDIGAVVGIRYDEYATKSGYGFFLAYDTNDSDTAYLYYVCDSTCYPVSSGVAPATSWHRLKIDYDGSGTATFSMYDSAGTLVAGSTKTFCSAASGCDVNSVSFPGSGATMMHTFIVRTRSTVAATMDVDFFSWKMTGLNR